MIHLPKDIVNKSMHIKALNPDISAFLITSAIRLKTNSVLQTMHCLEYVLKGNNTIQRGSIVQKTVARGLTFRKKGNYQFEFSKDYAAVLFFFDNAFINFFFEKHNISIKKEIFTADLPPFHFKSFDFIHQQIEEVVSLIKKPVAFAACLLELSLHQILLQITSREPTRSFINYLKFTASHYKIDLPFFMEQSFTQQLTLKEIAEKTGRSISSFKKDFKILFGTTPFKWILKRRLEYAHYLIDNTSLSLSEICDKCGIKNTSHFSKAYKSKFQVAPSENRKSIKSG